MVSKKDKKKDNNLTMDKLFHLNRFFLWMIGIYPPAYERKPVFAAFMFYTSIIVDFTFVILQLLGAITVANSITLPE
jgi:hypothetical protein